MEVWAGRGSTDPRPGTADGATTRKLSFTEPRPGISSGSTTLGPFCILEDKIKVVFFFKSLE